MIEARELTKRYGDTTAVHSLSFTITPGTVTGFPGPNGAGTSTTMRMIMGLARPTSGTVTVNSKPYRHHRAPLRGVGALPETSAVHPAAAAMLLGMFVTQSLRPLAAVASGADLEVLRELIEAGTITPPVDRSYTLAETPEAIRYFVEEHARGKITVTVTSQNNTKEQHQ